MLSILALAGFVVSISILFLRFRVYAIDDNQLTGGPGDGVYIGDIPEYGPAGSITATISNNIISSWQHGIHLVSSVAGATITGNTIQNNVVVDSGIHIEAAVDANNIHVNYNNIEGNIAYGIFNGGTGILYARFNWWGHETGPYHGTSWEYMGKPYGPHYGLGDNVSDYVLYYPWLPVVHDVAVIDISVSPSARALLQHNSQQNSRRTNHKPTPRRKSNNRFHLGHKRRRILSQLHTNSSCKHSFSGQRSRRQHPSQRRNKSQNLRRHKW